MEHYDPNLDAEKLLILELAKGNEAVFKKLYDTCVDKIYAYGLSLLKCEAHAEELVQDVFLTVWIERENLDTSLSFSSYLYTMARNKVFDFLKKAASDSKLREEVFYRSQKSYGPKSGKIPEADMENVKQRLIVLLPPGRKLIFEMLYNDGKSYDDISRELGISLSTVKSQMGKAQKTIRAHLLRAGRS